VFLRHPTQELDVADDEAIDTRVRRHLVRYGIVERFA
jgi:hypothetical protein